MCGIVGIFDTKQRPISPELVERMTTAVAHRGPDGDGFYCEKNLGFGHRRLAIIDLSPAGKQPRMSHDGRYVINFNGEIYNYRELRVELEAKGHHFFSETDTEVLLSAYIEWGDEAFLKLNGMFALGIWDREKNALVLARDRFGVKPLYYFLKNGVLAFASEIKALLQHPELSARVNEAVLLEYFTFQNVFSRNTLFQDVHMLPAGYIGHIALGDEQVRLQEFWDFHFAEPEERGDPREYIEELDRLFVQAVNTQLVSDVPVGAYLSGGMDSAGITAIASREIKDLTTFTGGFDMSSVGGIEQNFDERERAEALSYRYGTEHYEIVMKAGDMERAFPTLIWHLEDLRVGQSYPNYYVSKLASKFGPVVLAGTGGDEIFAGYPWRYYHATQNADYAQYIENYYGYWQRLVSNKSIHQLFVPEIWNLVKDIRTVDIFSDVFGSKYQDYPDSPEWNIHRSLYFESKTFLHGLLLVEDKLSMAHGLETRVPFLDNDLVDFAMRLPISTKLKNLGDSGVTIDENEPGSKTNLFFSYTNDGKLILREMLARYLPKDYEKGMKKGFSAPDASWFRGESIDYVKEVITNKNSRIYDYLQFDTVNGLVSEHFSGQRNKRLLIWSLLSFEWWIRKFLT